MSHSKKIIISIVIIAIAGGFYSWIAEFKNKEPAWMGKSIRTLREVKADELYSKPVHHSISELTKELKSAMFKEKKVKHHSLRGIYITAETAASNHFSELIDTLIQSGGNMVVMDIELSGGQLAFIPKDDYLTAINPGSPKLENLKSIIKELHRKDIYVIARQVIFNDPYTANRKPEWKIRYSEGGIYDHRWLDPSHPDVQNYNLLISREVAKLGFDEIQYDYIRFPDGYHYGLNYYYNESTTERWEVINDFLKEAKTVLNEYDVKLGVDVFGATVWGNIDWTLVGQFIPEIAKTVDVIYPMTYPSHVSPGYYGFQNPYGDPYSFVQGSIEKFVEAADGNAEIRTWVQGFPLKVSNFGDWFMKEQVRGTYDGGANDFVIWSPGNRYGYSWSSMGMEPPEKAIEEPKPVLEKDKQSL